MTYLFTDWQAGVTPPKSWDCADAIADGWDKPQLDAVLRTAKPWTPPGDSRPSPPIEPHPASAVPAAMQTPASEAQALEFKREPGVSAGTNEQRPAGGPSSSGGGDDALVRHGLPMPRDNGRRPILDPRDPMPSARALLADRFMSHGLRAVHHYRGTFWRWDGACYRDADTDSMQAQVWDYLDTARRYGKEGEVIDYQPSRSTVDNVMSAFRAVSNLPANVEAPTWLSKQRDHLPADELLAVRNGLLHLSTGQLVNPSPEFFCLNSSDVDYDPGAPEPVEWLRFLDLLWPDDTQSIDALQDVFGYLLSPDTSQQKIPLLVGPKRSGKGTIARVLTALLGHESVTAPTLASLATNFGLSPLIGKSVAIIGDARLSGKADQSAIAERLLSISGEDSITVDRKFQTAWTGRLGVRFVIMSNELPRLSDASGALASRFIVLTMDQSFYGREDRGLAGRLLNELPGILNWARDGYLRLRERGYFLQPDSAKDAIDELEALGSPISAFVKERCVVANGRRGSVDAIFAAWREWCEANGRREAGTAQSFGRDLRAAVAGLRITRPRLDGGQSRYYEGIDLQTADKPPKQFVDDW